MDRGLVEGHAPTPGLWRPARVLYITALTIFVVTVVIGILNGLDLVAFGQGEGVLVVEEGLGRRLLLTHLHAGTLGFITLAIVAGAFRMFTEGRPVDPEVASAARGVGTVVAICIALYVVAFGTTQGILRPVAGTLVFLAVGWLFAWVIGRMREAPVTVPQLGLFGAFVSLVIGAVFGVLLGVFVARGSLPGVSNELGARIGEAHPGTMVVGYLILAGFALIEWLITDDQRQARTDRWGVAQVIVVFLAGMVALVGILAGNFQIAGLNIPLEIAGLVMFIVRMRRELAPGRWRKSVPGLYARLALVWLVGALTALAILIGGLVSGAYADFEDVPLGLVLAMDHMNFVGVMTMATLGLLVAALGSSRRRDWWLLAAGNAGLLLFVSGLLSESAILKRIGTPVLGAALLTAIWLYVDQLRRTTRAVTMS